MKTPDWPPPVALVLSTAGLWRRLLRRAGELTYRWLNFFAPCALIACASPGYIEVPTYQHYYFYEARVSAVLPSIIDVRQDGKNLDLAFRESENTLSITTFASRGDQGLIVGNPGKVTNYTGLLAFDALGSEGGIPMRLWVAASCLAEDWVIYPGSVRLVDPTRNLLEIPLTAYRQPLPAVPHPDSRVLTGYWQYKPLDSNQQIHCQKGSTVAFTVGFEMTLELDHLRVVFADGLQRDGEVLHVPDVDLSLTGGKKVESTTRIPQWMWER
jgi:hypothetical protein